MSFIQSVINGVSVGSAYVLMGLGLTVVYNVYRLLNLAHGEYYMLGAFAALLCVTVLEIPFYVAILAAMLITGILGVVTERLVFRPLLGHSEADQLIATIGLFFLIDNVALYLLTPNVRSIISPLQNTVLKLGALTISGQRVMNIVVTVILIIILQYFYSRTKTGKQMRAVAQDRECSLLMGIDITFIGKVAFFLSCSLAALAGTLTGVIQQISPTMGFNPLLFAMVVVVLGGLGSNIGAIIGGIFIGITTSLSVTYFSAAVADVLVYLILFLVLIFKPEGLFGGKSHG